MADTVPSRLPGGYRLPARHVIHAVGPIYIDGRSGNRRHCVPATVRSLPTTTLRTFLDGRHERGLSEVTNGLALCKIHHSAYDVNILGASPDYRVHTRADVLREHDECQLTWAPFNRIFSLFEKDDNKESICCRQ